MKAKKIYMPIVLIAAIVLVVLCQKSAYALLNQELPKVIKEAKEPSLELGNKIYKHYCTPCHGKKGDGTGFNAPNLLVKPANHTDSKFMSERTNQKLSDAVDLGGKEIAKSTLMPPWGSVLGDIGIKAIVLKLRDLCQCKGPREW